MTLQIYNTLSQKKEEFTPLDPLHINMYVCGVTPYDDCHLGHARAYVTFDVIRRHLLYRGYQVKYIQNFTNIDDKIIARAKELGEDPIQLSQRYTEAYFDVMDRLGVLRADEYPRVTDHIPEIIQLIQTLEEREKAYQIDGDVYYSIQSFSSSQLLSLPVSIY